MMSFSKTTNTENKSKYSQTLAKYRKLCRQKQKKHERDFTEAIGNEAEQDTKNKAKKDIGTLKKPNGEYTVSREDTTEETASCSLLSSRHWLEVKTCSLFPHPQKSNIKIKINNQLHTNYHTKHRE